MPATTRPSLSSIVVKIRNYWFFSIVPKVLNFQCHKLLFLGGYIPPESSTKLYDISGRNYNVHVQVIGQIHHFYLSMIDPTPVHRCEPVTKIDANQSQKSLRTPLRRNGVHQPWWYSFNYYLYTIEQWALRTWVWCSYAGGRRGKLEDFLLKHVYFSLLLFNSYSEKPIEMSRTPRGGHITYRCNIWSDLFLRNKSYRLLKLLVSSNDL